MAKTKRSSPSSPSSTPALLSSPSFTDLSVLASLLSIDYPLIDPPLIYAILSDYDPSDISQHLEEIKENLGILEATLVPDGDDFTGTDNDTDGDADAELGKKFDGLTTSSSSGIRDTLSSGVKDTASSSSKDAHKDGIKDIWPETGPDAEDGHDEGFLDEQTLLLSLFPYLSRKQVTDALTSEISLQAAIDHLLSVELIRDVELNGLWPDETSSNPGSDSEQSRGRVVEPSLRPKTNATAPKKAKKKDKRTIPLVDTLQRQPSPVSSRASSRSPSRTAAGPSSNAWHTMASLSFYLSELLSQPTSHFLSFCHAPEYHSAYSAIKASLLALPRSGNGVQDERAQSVLQDLYGVSLLKQDNQDLELCVRVSGGNVATTMDLMDLLAEISAWPGDDDLYDLLNTSTPAVVTISTKSTPSSSPLVTQAPVLPSIPHPHPPTSFLSNPNRMRSRPTSSPPGPKIKIIPGSKPAVDGFSYPTSMDDSNLPPRPPPALHLPKNPIQHPLNWRTVSHARRPRDRSAILHPYAAHIPSYGRKQIPATSSSSSTSMSYQECLDRALIERQKRQESIRSVGRYFAKSSCRGIAGHYALEARAHDAKAREWELRAARLVIQQQLQRSGNKSIDLHHLTIAEASELSLESAEKWYTHERSLHDHGLGHVSTDRGRHFVPTSPLTIVTGVGRHSAGNRGVLGPAVASALEGAGWRVDRGDNSRGYIVLRGRK
ncbi:hypothetical protein P7C73_g6108, partial [Tremellales sp. Uapishka_1]